MSDETDTTAPIPTETTPAAAPTTLDYDQLAAAIVRAQQAAVKPAPAPTPAPAPAAKSSDPISDYARLMLAREMASMRAADEQAAAAKQAAAAAAVSPSARISQALAPIMNDDSLDDHARNAKAAAVARKMLAGMRVVPDSAPRPTTHQFFGPFTTRKP